MVQLDIRSDQRTLGNFIPGVLETKLRHDDASLGNVEAKFR